MLLPEIDLKDFQYTLPDTRIPDRPSSERQGSKLLVYKNQIITKSTFLNISRFLPEKCLIVFNNSKVIPARLFFKTINGATIEVLCLQESKEPANQLSYNSQIWKCIVGNLKRWKEGQLLQLSLPDTNLTATLIKKNQEDNLINFQWEGDYTFLEILEKAGQIPLPPYMNRTADIEDNVRYQTVYALAPGSVAAPTAGLHFTPEIIDELKTNGHQIEYVTLHVGAGTFKPIKTDKIENHLMHEEIFEVSEDFLQQLLNKETIIPVGTTSMRTLESICILGAKFKKGDFILEVGQWDGFTVEKISLSESINSILLWLKQNEKSSISVKTSIIIVPGYEFRICSGLITNFHQPESTLILLVAAFLGDKWKKVYDYALENDFRFLSYGDSSLLLP